MELNLIRGGLHLERALFKIIGHWPFGNPFVYNLYKFFTIVCMILYNLTQLIQLLISHDHLEETAWSLNQWQTTTSACVKIIMFGWKVGAMIDIVQEQMRQPEFQPRNAKQADIARRDMAFANLMFYYYFVMGMTTSIFWALRPLLQRQRFLPTEAWFPYEHSSGMAFWLTYMFQAFFVPYHALIAICLDMLFASLMIHIGIQCDMLNDQLENLTVEDYQEQLLKCIEHHKLILRLAKGVEDAFTLMVFTQFAASLLVLCETMFVLSLVKSFNGYAVMLVFYMIAIFTQVFVYCYSANEVIIKSERLSQAIFSSQWYSNTSLRSMRNDVLLFIQRTQTPIIIYVGNIFPISLVTFGNILRSSWAYFMALHDITTTTIDINSSVNGTQNN